MHNFSPLASHYPSHAFPGLLGEMMDCLSVCGIAAEIIGTQLLAFLSLLTQGVADVLWPNGIKVPVGANCLLIAPSGTGKTLIFKILCGPVEQYLASHACSGDPAKSINLFVEDATKEAILLSLRDWLVAGLFTDEAGQLKKLLRDGPTLVKLLDGSPLRSARVSTGRVELRDQRFCMLLMEQPEVFEATKSILGTAQGGVGLINRFFVTRSQGNVQGASLHLVQFSTSVKLAYANKIKVLLDATIKHVQGKTAERHTLHLSEDAAKYLTEIGNKARKNSAENSPWFFISEYIARHAERVLRLAGAFHVFEHGAKGEISLDLVRRAATLDGWHIETFAQMAYVPTKQSKAEIDAVQIKDALHRIYHSTGTTMFRLSEMRSGAVNIGLTTGRFDRALAVLGEQGSIRVFTHDKKTWVELIFGHYFNSSRFN